MRYRKSIKICKGVKVNLSKSGPSLTVGGKGASINVGSKGTFLNTGIPGTGLYDRQKIGGNKKNNSANIRNSNCYTNYTQSSPQTYSILYDENAVVTIIDGNGEAVTDQYIVKKIKSTNEYKAEIERLSQIRIKQLEEQVASFVSIYKKSAKVYPTNLYKKKLEFMQTEKYTKNKFNKEQPTIEDVREELLKQAVQEISTKKFWKRNRLIEEYVTNNINDVLNTKRIQWEKERDAFDKKELIEEQEANKRFEAEFIKNKAFKEKLLANDSEAVCTTIDRWISNLEFPFEFNIDYELKNEYLFVDLDLPEIEDMPIYCAQRMANGTVKVKQKPQKEIKEDYYKCVLGLALFFATNLMCHAIGVEEIVISAYTQRRNSKGEINDEYIYSIKFDRYGLSKVDLTHEVDKIVFAFENICLPKADKQFKKIQPFE